MANWSLLLDCIDRGRQNNGKIEADYIETDGFYVPCAQLREILQPLERIRHNGCLKRKYPDDVVSICLGIGGDECIRQFTQREPCEYASRIISEELQRI